MNKRAITVIDNLQFGKTVLLRYIYNWQQNTLYVLLAITVQLEYINHCDFSTVMLALCLMPSVTYYAQNYAGIISWSLSVVKGK